MTTTLTPIRIKLLAAREAKELTQAGLARLADVRIATISDIENGKTTRIDLAVVERLCRVLGIEPGDLLVMEGEPKATKRGKKK